MAIQVINIAQHEYEKRRHAFELCQWINQKRNIIWEGEMVEVDADEQRCTELMFERLQAKVKTGSYGEDTAILVHLAEHCPISMRNRANLVQRTRRYILEEQPSIGGVYYCYTAGYIIDAVGRHEA